MAQIEKMIDSIKELTVLELNQLVKALEDEFGVSAAAAAPVMVAGADVLLTALVHSFGSEFRVSTGALLEVRAQSVLCLP